MEGDRVRQHGAGRRLRRLGQVLGLGLALAMTVLSVLAALMARRVVTPVSDWPDDIEIHSLNLSAPTGSTITIRSNPDTRLPGRYSFGFSNNAGHAVLGDIVAQDARWVTRSIEGIHGADLSSASHGRLGAFVHQTPRDLNLTWESVEISTEIGLAPAWLFPAAKHTSNWVIHVHGRGSNRREALRAVPVLHEAGQNSLLISYRNDGEAPASPDKRYGLGDTEWRDVESAIEFAANHGAERIVLMGWSMGGAVALQSAHRTTHPDLLTGLILESPVIDWASVLDFLGSSLRLPRLVAPTARYLLGQSWAGRLTGLNEPIDFGRLDFVARASELALPVLLLHSDDDGYVPATGSHKLSGLRPDLVTLHRFTVARHAKLWNYDPERWNEAITSWLGALPQSGHEPTGHN